MKHRQRIYLLLLLAAIVFLSVISSFQPQLFLLRDAKIGSSPSVYNNIKVSQVLFTTPVFQNLPDIQHYQNYITIGLTIITGKRQTFSYEFAYKMKLNLKSLLTFSSGDPLYFVIITDKKSLRESSRILNRLFSQYLSEGVITTEWRRMKGMPRLKVSFVDVNEIIKTDVKFFEAMKNNSLQGNDPRASYTESLFYIAPVYHKAFTGLNQIIFLDSKNLEFRSDIGLLHRQFEKMSSSALIGIGPDLTPHYRNILSDYISREPNTSLGLPGPSQGFNSGVVLYQLERMRRSELYNYYTSPGGVDELMTKYSYRMFLAEQDWLTNLGFSHPHLIHNLPCQFNRQTSIRKVFTKVTSDIGRASLTLAVTLHHTNLSSGSFHLNTSS